MEKRKMELLALVLPVFFLLLSVQEVFSLQEVAGTLVISVPIGGSNSARWGLINDGNQTITVSLSSTGNAAQYLSFPATVNLQPGIIDYVSITATTPSASSAGNITGTLYALQQGQPGQVQINVQMIKSVTIAVTGQSTSAITPSGVGGGVTIYTTTTTTSTIPASPKATSTTTTTIPTTPTTVPTTTTTVPATSLITGFATFVSSPSGISVLFLIIVLAVLGFVFYKKWYVKKSVKS